MWAACSHEIEQQSITTKIFNAYRVRLKNAHTASSSPSFHFYSVSAPLHSVMLILYKPDAQDQGHFYDGLLDACCMQADIGPVHNIFLSPYEDYRPGSDQYDWFYNDLISVDRTLTPWVTLNVHNPWCA